MCTFRSEREVVVCDVAIDHVRAELQGLARTDVTYWAADEGGTTLVQAGEVVDPETFVAAVRRGMGRVVPDEVQGRRSRLLSIQQRGAPLLDEHTATEP
jgi:hypothetical protein